MGSYEPEPRYGHATAVVGTKILMFGGANRHVQGQDGYIFVRMLVVANVEIAKQRQSSLMTCGYSIPSLRHGNSQV